MPARTVSIGGLLKFGQKEHIYNLFENGTVYCNTLKFFRDHEKPAIDDTTFSRLSYQLIE